MDGREGNLTLQFGAFEIDPQAGELRKRGARIRLQEQPFRLLCALVEHPGEVISREELRGRIWPADTFVDFNSSLNIAVLKVQQALGDSASHPRFVETIPRRGYRFLAPVAQANPDERGGGMASGAQTIRSAAHTRPYFYLGAAAVIAGALGLTAFFVISPEPAPVISAALPLTAFPGAEVNPALSPDGQQVAFAWDGLKQNNFDIYIAAMRTRSSQPVRLTASPAHEFAPAWSIDGRKIAFLRQSGGDRGELLVVSASGGPEYRVARIRSREIELRSVAALSWSADGQWIAASHREPTDEADGIYAFSVTGVRQRLTTPSKGEHGHYMPAFSPRGNALAYCRMTGASASDIHVLPLASNLAPSSASKRVTGGKGWSAHPIWIRNGNALIHVFGEHAGSQRELRMTSFRGSKPQTQALPIRDEPWELTAGATSLVYSRRVRDTNIWRARIPALGEPPAVPERLISTTQADGKPSYSPDGRKIAFISRRSGFDEIWISDADGGNPVQMTFLGGPLVGTLRWSPDGQWLAFHARPEGQADLFVIPAAGGSPVRLTDNASDDTMPSYSHDGNWIYFISRRAGPPLVWKMPSEGGDATQVTSTQPAAGSTMPLESVDGASVYYVKWPNPNAIWAAPVQGGRPEYVIGPTQGFPVPFAVTSEGIYYPAPPHAGEERYIRFFQFSTRRSYPVVTINRALDLGISVSPDRRFLLFDQVDQTESDLMLVSDFRH